MIRKEEFSTLKYIQHYSRAYFWNILNKFGLVSLKIIKDTHKVRIASFDEYPPCEMCGSTSNSQVLIVEDKSRIVKCVKCGLHFTSPRIKENVWLDFLRNETQILIEYTENRIKYGVALSENIKFVYPNWYERRLKRENMMIEEIESCLDATLKRLHDVGCGVGFLLLAANKKGISVTGNELNKYACKVMKERLGLEVFNEVLENCSIKEGSLDAIEMNDYIEHTYHPLQDLIAAYRFLRKGGIIRIETFHIDSRSYDKYKEKWNMLFWNHVFHFSTQSLLDMIKKAGFSIVSCSSSYENHIMKVVARK